MDAWFRLFNKQLEPARRVPREFTCFMLHVIVFITQDKRPRQVKLFKATSARTRTTSRISKHTTTKKCIYLLRCSYAVQVHSPRFSSATNQTMRPVHLIYCSLLVGIISSSSKREKKIYLIELKRTRNTDKTHIIMYTNAEDERHDNASRKRIKSIPKS